MKFAHLDVVENKKTTEIYNFFCFNSGIILAAIRQTLLQQIRGGGKKGLKLYLVNL